jgi:hypothetical protein
VLRGERHQPSLRRKLEAFFESRVRLLPAAEQRERLAEREPGALEQGVKPGRALQERQRIGGPVRLHQ